MKTPHTDVIEHNRRAWNRQVDDRIRWTVPVSSAAISDARSGYPKIILTPKKIVPRDWFPSLQGCRVLALAGGGGQQGPLLAAAGAEVTVLDLSERQLEQDQLVAHRENLTIHTVQGNAGALPFDPQSFDLVVNPCSMSFFPDIRPVWGECSRILKLGGFLMTGFTNPVLYTFDIEKFNQGEFVVKYPLPYSDEESLSNIEKQRFIHAHQPREFSHTFTDIIGGLVENGFVIDKFYEDAWEPHEVINEFFPPFMALRAEKVAL